MNLFKDKKARRLAEASCDVAKDAMQKIRSLEIELGCKQFVTIGSNELPVTAYYFNREINNINAQLEEIRQHLGIARVYHHEKITLEKTKKSK